MEAGVFALSRLRIRQQMRAGRRSARLLHEYLENPGELFVDHPGGKHGGQFPHSGLAGAGIAPPASGPTWSGLWWFTPSAVFLFYALFDLLPKMLFRCIPNRLCVLLAGPFRLAPFHPPAAGGGGGVVFRACCCAGGRKGLYGSSFRQSRGTAISDAGFRADFNFGGTRDDQSCARPADPHGAASDVAPWPRP